MANRFYRIVDSQELAAITTNRVIQKNLKPWDKYKENEAVFVLSELATVSDLRALAERQSNEGKHAHIVEIEVVGPQPWSMEQDRSFANYDKAIAVLSDIVESETIKINTVAKFVWQQNVKV